MFDKLYSAIDEAFGDVLPDSLCIDCAVEGVVEGFAIGGFALAAIALAPGWLAVGLTVGLAGFGVYGGLQLANSWDRMSDEDKSKAMGQIAGGLLAGRFGPKLPPKTISYPTAVRGLALPDGRVVPVLATSSSTISVPGTLLATASSASAAGSGGGGGKEPPPEKKAARNSKIGERLRTPDSHKEDFNRLPGGNYKNRYTGEVWQRSKTDHRGDKWKVGPKRGKPPTDTKISVHEDGRITKIDK